MYEKSSEGCHGFSHDNDTEGQTRGCARNPARLLETALLLEVSGGELGLLFQRLAPVIASFLDISLGLQRMA